MGVGESFFSSFSPSPFRSKRSHPMSHSPALCRAKTDSAPINAPRTFRCRRNANDVICFTATQTFCVAGSSRTVMRIAESCKLHFSRRSTRPRFVCKAERDERGTIGGNLLLASLWCWFRCSQTHNLDQWKSCWPRAIFFERSRQASFDLRQKAHRERLYVIVCQAPVVALGEDPIAGLVRHR